MYSNMIRLNHIAFVLSGKGIFVHFCGRRRGA